MVVSNNNINVNEDDVDTNITNNKKISFTPTTMATIHLGGVDESENGTSAIKTNENYDSINGQMPIQFVTKTPRTSVKTSQQQNYPNDDNSLEIEKLKSLINQEEQLK